MILHVPNLDTLRLALTAGAVPPAVSLAPAAAGFGGQGQVWVQPSVDVEPAAVAELRRLGATVCKPQTATLDQAVECWPQLLPLARVPGAVSLTDTTPVLFELPEAELPEVVGEILRLGNDRQSFRWLADGHEARGLLRVIGPPYYSLLRALDREGDDAPRAYVERSPRVWVAAGYTHPLVEQLQPPPGKLLLMWPPRQWTFIAEARLRDIYDVMEFRLPDAPLHWQDREPACRLTVPLRLGPGGTEEPAELWVLPERGVEQLDALVGQADDQLLARLAFAVAEAGDRQTVVLRVRPSRLPPPVLVLEGIACRPYLRLPNLFLPCGTRLHPPLRRGVVGQLLAADPTQVTWLYPEPEGHFTPQSLPDTAFRPLADWVDYLLDHDHQALTAWVQSTRFDFEPFICTEEEPKSDRKPPRRKPDPEQKPKGPGDKGERPRTGKAPALKGVTKSRPPRTEEPAAQTPSPTRADELRKRLRELEDHFLKLTTPPDDGERQDLWRQMARLNAAVGQAGDTTVCWGNALWEVDDPPPAWLSEWLRAERTGAAHPEPTAAELDRLLSNPQPTAPEMRGLAAALGRAAHAGQPAPDLVQRLGRIRLCLEQFEALLPVRVAWLAWDALNRLSGGDVLALARARDRLLERLYQQGLRPDIDVPGFLRFAEARARERFQGVRDQVRRIRQWTHSWIDAAVMKAPCTGAYADLMFAFCLARLGEASECRVLLTSALAEVANRDHIHDWLGNAFAYRIRQALDGKANTGRLPAELLNALPDMTRDDRLVIDRLREFSRILEPHEKIESYRHWHGYHADDLDRELALLFDTNDPAELARQLSGLLEGKRSWGRVKAPQARILGTALELAPRLGEVFARSLLDRVVPALTSLADLPLEQARLLEKGLFLAAHFDQAGCVQSFVAHLHQLLEAQAGTTGTLEEFQPLLEQCFRGLRKLGMREEIGRLFARMAELVLQGRQGSSSSPFAFTAAKQGPAAGEWCKVMQLLLPIAAGWFYFGQEAWARHLVDEARDLLLDGDLLPWQQTPLACAYARTLGQAPLELALPRFAELLRKIERVQDAFVTNSHYSLSRLRLVEAVVLALAGDDFALDRASRRWLDEDEYLVRRRVHRDVRAALSRAGL